ncbi:TetR family transcriptional regulator [Streptomyces subrutilus]|uniref:TetR family transcriptional regulator n=1 Tax=Streptomyces subrutilus TaxID=36818 RepID=A0A5P2UU99_9ACTN|nr:TetR/AcrR family transcriptional regulator [Streptomyces subrutilus]QEU82470.1 TetR/AcrR family transcriptional regulator [Streptomyces subrutilus]GGZ81440.1 TetR family transcriptional regulator [Streptomyces subrutilus]
MPDRPETAAPPARRRDAQRSRDRLTAAAREVFTELGLEAPLDVIARRAGVGNATLYRHYPSRAALVEAVFHDTLADTMAVGDRARHHDDAWAGLTDYLDEVFAVLAADRGTNDLMTTALDGVESLRAVHAHNRRTIDDLLRRGREQGTVRADATTEDLLFALAALGRAVPALASAAGPRSWRRPLALLLAGLRPPSPASPLPRPALTPTQLADTLKGLGPHRAPPGEVQAVPSGPSPGASGRPGRAGTRRTDHGGGA